MTTLYRVIDTKTGETLGHIEKFRKDISPPNHPISRASIRRWWYRVQGDTANADTKSALGVVLARKGSGKFKVEELA